jgi:hypothetical protein
MEAMAFGIALEGACDELGIGASSLDVSKRERIACLILECIRKGESDADVLRRRAVLHFTNTPQPAV